MTRSIRWGILGTGNIARQFAAGLQDSARGQLLAVASRQAESAEAVARSFQVPRAYGSYEQLLADPEVEAIHVALPNALHHAWTIRALRAGKHVLCEKPIAVCAAQAEEMFDEARRAGKVLIEALMYRAHPQTQAVLEVVRSGRIGEVRLVRCSFCFRCSRPQGNIRFDAGLAGGALMDVGVYCVSFACLLAGQLPDAVHAVGLVRNGIDELAAASLAFPGGMVAVMSCGMSVHADNTASICGSEGYIEIPVPWKPPRPKATFIIGRSAPPRMDGCGQSVCPGPARQTVCVEVSQDVYAIEADRFAAAIIDGADWFVRPEESVGVMRVLDGMRRQVGLAF